MEKLLLTKPFILQNGNELTEFSLYFDALATADFRQIRRLEAQITDGPMMGSLTVPSNLQSLRKKCVCSGKK